MKIPKEYFLLDSFRNCITKTNGGIVWTNPTVAAIVLQGQGPDGFTIEEVHSAYIPSRARKALALGCVVAGLGLFIQVMVSL